MTGLKLKIGSDDFGSSSIIWYPASGYRYYYDGALNNVGYSGYYWSVTPVSDHAYYLRFDFNGNVSPTYSYYRAYGFSVRCLQESK